MSPQETSQKASSACPNCGATEAVRIFSRSINGKDWYLAKCPQCTQHYTDPLPTLDEIKGFYSNDYHSNLFAENATETEFEAKFQRYAKWITTYIKGGRSLDVGCTTGLFPYILKQRGFQAEGLEINSATASWGEKHYGITIRNEPFETADYEEKSFNLVSLADVLEHSLDPSVTLGHVHSILQDGGFAFISFPDIHSLESRYYRALSLATHRNWLWSTCHIPHHTWEFTRPTAQALFNKMGFNVVGFRRAYISSFERTSPLVALLTAPPQVLSLVGTQLGTQMEFVLQKR
jgi:2-polyprenyl-3-methyl-5-hydroxy-6-metoxy-1,4-benzoquinol methylase